MRGCSARSIDETYRTRCGLCLTVAEGGLTSRRETERDVIQDGHYKINADKLTFLFFDVADYFNHVFLYKMTILTCWTVFSPWRMSF